MDAFPFGATIRLKSEIRNSASGALETPPSVTCNVRRPTGALANPAVVVDGTGLVHADYLPTESGPHYYSFTDPSGPGADPASAGEGGFYVRPAV